MNSYLELEGVFKKLGLLGRVSGLLSWDTETMMPLGASNIRGEEMAVMSTTLHEIITAPETKKLINLAEKEESSLNEWQKSNLRIIRNEWRHNNCLSEELVKKYSIATLKCQTAWKDAVKNNDIRKFEPYQQEVVDISRAIAEEKAKSFDLSPYDAMLNQYDEGRRSEQIDDIFNKLKAFLPDLIKKIQKKQETRIIKYPKGPFLIEKQEMLGRKFMEAIGFDFNHGRLDVSAHPFTGGAKGDVRITTRYNDKEFFSSLMEALHETGHGMYEQQLPEEWKYQLVGQAQGMTIHESQSLLIENQVAHSREFLKFALPIIKGVFGGSGNEWDIENIYNINNHVRSSLIRVNADEATYPIHIIIRYEIEKDLIGRKIQVKDIPDIWQSMTKDMLGIDVPDCKSGYIQDLHWPDGDFGYFPTYTLGAIAAAQFFYKAKSDKPEILPEIAKGNFSPLSTWLKDNIHSHGSKYTADELIKKTTGNHLDVDIFRMHLEGRYL